MKTTHLNTSLFTSRLFVTLKKYNMRSGFSLIELLIVVVTMGILASITLTSFANLIHICFKNSEACLNQDPIQKKCHKDAKTKQRIKVDDIEVELRYSPKCHMTWPRSTAPPNSKIYVADMLGESYGNSKIRQDGYTRHYGNMGPGNAIAACAELNDSNLICTEGIILQ